MTPIPLVGPLVSRSSSRRCVWGRTASLAAQPRHRAGRTRQSFLFPTSLADRCCPSLSALLSRSSLPARHHRSRSVRTHVGRAQHTRPCVDSLSPRPSRRRVVACDSTATSCTSCCAATTATRTSRARSTRCATAASRAGTRQGPEDEGKRWSDGECPPRRRGLVAPRLVLASPAAWLACVHSPVVAMILFRGWHEFESPSARCVVRHGGTC